MAPTSLQKPGLTRAWCPWIWEMAGRESPRPPLHVSSGNRVQTVEILLAGGAVLLTGV